MEYLNDIKLVVTAEDAAGEPRFLDDLTPLETGAPGANESLKFWRFDSDAWIPGNIGSIPHSNRFTGPGGALFGIFCFPPRARVLTREDLLRLNPDINIDESEYSMHCTDTIDMGFIISGRIDLHLPQDSVRTLEPGTAFVVGGSSHTWENPYDDPCVFTNVCVGVRRPAPDPA
jgi:hypothetical protein